MSPLRRLGWWAAGAAVALGLGALSFRLFLLYLARPDLDHGIHVVYAQRLVAEGTLLPHFLYHLLVALAAGFSQDTGRLTFAAALVLSLLVLAKVAVSLALLRELAARAGEPLTPAVAMALGPALAFVAPLPKWWAPDNIYLGQLSPTVWHNPTAITALPLAVASFWVLVQAGPPGWRRALGAGALLALSVCAKPNFAMVLLPALVLLRLLQRRLDLPRLVLVALPAVLVLAWQYAHALASGLEAPGAGVVTVQPLAVWRLYSPQPLVSALVSLAFPLAVAAYAGRRPRHREALLLAWLATAMAVLEFALLAEPEPRLGDANYYWGVVPATFLLFVVSTAELLAPRRPRAGGRAGRVGCWTLLALHAASGLVLYAVPFQLAVAD